jgi:DNA topoisomerase-1
MKRLLIVESPAKIKTIQKFLGPDFKIMATMGHIKDLPTKEMGVTRDPIALSYVAIDKKEKTIAELCKAAAGVDEVYLAQKTFSALPLTKLPNQPLSKRLKILARLI